MEPNLIPIIKGNNNKIKDKDCVKVNLHRDTTSQKSYPYEFKMALFDRGKPEEFLLFLRNFNMTLEASGTLAYTAKIQYLSTLVRGESLRQFDRLSTEVGGTTLGNLESIILGLGFVLFSCLCSV